jgi:hypothetical protein
VEGIVNERRKIICLGAFVNSGEVCRVIPSCSEYGQSCNPEQDTGLTSWEFIIDKVANDVHTPYNRHFDLFN